jgi:hypothetical protein
VRVLVTRGLREKRAEGRASKLTISPAERSGVGVGEHARFVSDDLRAGSVVLKDLGIACLVIPDGPRRNDTAGIGVVDISVTALVLSWARED